MLYLRVNNIRKKTMPLWTAWWNALYLLRPAFSRLRSFMWFVTVVAGFTVRIDLLGVTSIVRALKLEPRFYNKLLANFHSEGVKRESTQRAVGQGGVALVAQPAARQWPTGSGCRRHQGWQGRQEDAGRQTVASGIGLQYQT